MTCRQDIVINCETTSFMVDYLKVGNELLPRERIKRVNISQIEQNIVTVYTDDGTFEALGFDAVELVLALKPSALEGRRIKWRSGAWNFHNFMHALMPIMIWFGYKKQAIRLHDWSTPRMRDLKSPFDPGK